MASLHPTAHTTRADHAGAARPQRPQRRGENTHPPACGHDLGATPQTGVPTRHRDLPPLRRGAQDHRLHRRLERHQQDPRAPGAARCGSATPRPRPVHHPATLAGPDGLAPRQPLLQAGMPCRTTGRGPLAPHIDAPAYSTETQLRSPSPTLRTVLTPSTERLRSGEFDDYSPTPSGWRPSATPVIVPVRRQVVALGDPGSGVGLLWLAGEQRLHVIRFNLFISSLFAGVAVVVVAPLAGTRAGALR